MVDTIQIPSSTTSLGTAFFIRLLLSYKQSLGGPSIKQSIQAGRSPEHLERDRAKVKKRKQDSVARRAVQNTFRKVCGDKRHASTNLIFLDRHFLQAMATRYIPLLPLDWSVDSRPNRWSCPAG
jgi:hypothetical protein